MPDVRCRPSIEGVLVWAYVTAGVLAMIWSWEVAPARRAMLLTMTERDSYRERLRRLGDVRDRTREARAQARQRGPIMRAIDSLFTPDSARSEPLMRRLLHSRQGLLDLRTPIERTSTSFLIRESRYRPTDLEALLDSVQSPRARSILPAGTTLVRTRLKVGRHAVSFRFHATYRWLVALLTAIECYPFRVDLQSLDVQPILDKKGNVSDDPTLYGRATLVIHSLSQARR